MVNSIQIDDTASLFIIDYKSDVSEVDMKYILIGYMTTLTVLQGLKGTPAEEFGISVTIKIDGEDVNNFVVNKDFLTQ